MILKVFTSVGMMMTKQAVYAALRARYATSRYPDKKAAGSLGGAVHGGTLLRTVNSNGQMMYQRIR